MVKGFEGVMVLDDYSKLSLTDAIDQGLSFDDEIECQYHQNAVTAVVLC